MVKIAGSLAGFLFASGLVLAQSSAQKTSAGARENVQSWHGTLVDANCAGVSQASNANNTESGGAVDSGRPEKGHKKGHADAQNCAVSSSTTAFALKTKEGQVMKFDEVGNARAAEELKTKGSWSKDAASGKPIHTTVSGILNGDKVVVTSISGRLG